MSDRATAPLDSEPCLVGAPIVCADYPHKHADLLKPEEVLDVAAILKPSHFADKKLATVWQIVTGLIRDGHPASSDVVCNALPAGIGPDVVSEAMLSVVWPTRKTMLWHANRMIERAARRHSADRARKIAERSGDETATPEELARDMAEASEELREYAVQNIAPPASEAAAEYWKAYIASVENPVALGVPTGFPLFDSLVGGLHNSELGILAARPSVGKSSLACHIADNVAGMGLGVGLFSLEMLREQLIARSVARTTQIEHRQIRLRMVKDEIRLGKIQRAVEEYGRRPIWIMDRLDGSPESVALEAKRIRNQYGNLRLIVIDYIQLMNLPDAPRNSSRQERVAEISRRLKKLAIDMDVPVLALSQLSRDPEKDKSKPRRPTLSDLRDSGALEQDADIVMFLHRTFKGGEHNGHVSQLDWIVEKNRSGPCGVIPVTHKEDYQYWAVDVSTMKKAPAA